ncbi:phage Gp37/Gp68 family protein [Variovorax sp. UMC13]|uniref:phage Gp37/Gp68 family protein n=1 Tax=Variovorax sp. UMC13 TaxID=1862326 RepID=UPI001603DA3A|nr:phage Gp37/Gp68 family protein [Variovorax sp. UMC13]MBB1602003.1 hypothetical protein [Variovorax sp. UMC13]
MSANTKIEWADHTFNPWEGCQKVGPGCDHCYAETRNARFHGGTAINWGPGAARRRTSAANWYLPTRWNAQAATFLAQHGRRQRVFCASLADVFDNAVEDEWRADLATLISVTPDLDWLLLTKRIGNAASMLAEMFLDGPPPNIRIGATIVNQEEAVCDIPKLLRLGLPNFLSLEPLLGPVWIEQFLSRRCTLHGKMAADDLCDVRHARGMWDDYGPREIGPAPAVPGINWVIVGGESGPHARPMHPDWARALRNQCEAAGVPFLFKQHGEWAPGSGDPGRGAFKTAAIDWNGRVVRGGYEAPEYPKGITSADGWAMVHLVGKKAAGRLLDGHTHDGVPS